MRTEHVSVPLANLEDMIAAHMYAIGVLNDDEDVKVNIGAFASDELLVELKILKEERKVL